jgi:hypothetical protein
LGRGRGPCDGGAPGLPVLERDARQHRRAAIAVFVVGAVRRRPSTSWLHCASTRRRRA